jgi:Amt family ammonium transporter
MAAIVIGVVASCVCYYAMLFRIKKGLDETCDCWSVHGMGGMTGALLTGVFATAAVNNYTGLLYGNASQLIYQVIAVCVSVAYAFIVTFVLVKILDSTIGMTVKEEEEYVGLDISQHGERAYS